MKTNYFIGGWELQEIKGTTVNVNVPRNSWTDPTKGKQTGSTMCRSCVGALSTHIVRMIACVLMCLVVGIGQVWAETVTLTTTTITDPALQNNNYGNYNGTTKDFTTDGVTFTAQDIAYNANGSPTSPLTFATNQLIQVKKSTGFIMNKSSMPLTSLVVITNNSSNVTVTAGTANNNLSTVTATEETVSLPFYTYKNKTVSTTTTNGNMKKLTYNLTGKNFVKIAASSSSAAYISSIVLTYSTTSNNPSITVNPTSLSRFAATTTTASAAQSFTVTGANLTEDVTLLVDDEFELATTDNGTWEDELTIEPSNGSVSATIYVRLKSGLTVGTYSDKEVMLSSGDAEAEVSLSGSVSLPPVAVTGVTLSATTTTIAKGATTTLTATVAPDDATNKTITWSSSNTNIATVDNTGKVTGKAAGIATITVTTADGNKTATCTVTVTDKLQTPSVTVSGITSSSSTVSWDAVANADKYVLVVKEGGTAKYTNENASTGITVTGLTPNTAYTCEVTAIPASTSTIWQNSAVGSQSFTTLKEVTFHIAGSTTTRQNAIGQPVTPPEVSATAYPCGGKTFVGWYTGATIADGNKPSTGFTNAGSNITINNTDNDYYAVFATASSNTQTYTHNFADMDNFKATGANAWGNSYSTHTTTFTDNVYVSVTASKQTTTITDQPVTKGNDVIIKAPAGETISAASIVCTQWSNKTHKISLYTSTDGTTFSTTASATTPNNNDFQLSISDLEDNITAVKFTFSETGQVGLTSFSITCGGGYSDYSTACTEAVKYYVRGDMNKEGNSCGADEMSIGTGAYSGLYYKTYTLNTGNYGFKVTDNTTWASGGGEWHHSHFVCSDAKTQTHEWKNNDDNNVNFCIYKDNTEVTILFDPTSNNEKIYISGGVTPYVNSNLFGRNADNGFHALSWDDENAVWTFTTEAIEWNGGNVEYKVFDGAGWTTIKDNGSNGNISKYVGSGTYNFTFTYNPCSHTADVTAEVIPTRTATWHYNGTSTTSSATGFGDVEVVIPTPTTCANNEFLGWMTTELTAQTTTAPTIDLAKTATKVEISEDVHYYAVYSANDSENGDLFYLSYTSSGTTYYAGGQNGTDAWLKSTTNKTEAVLFGTELKSGTTNEYYLFYMNGEDKKYVTSGADGTGLTFTTSIDSNTKPWTISESNGTIKFTTTFTVANKTTRWLGFNTQQTRFAAYVGEQQLGDLVKELGGTTYYSNSCITIVPKPAKPEVDVPAGTYTEAKVVKVSNVGSYSATYTINGGTPVTYNAGNDITISETSTLTVTFCDGTDNCTSASFGYVIELPATVLWSVNGSTDIIPATTVAYDTELGTLPTPSSNEVCVGRVFVCWTTNPNYASNDAAPTGNELVTPTTKPAGDVTYYAVFAQTIGSQGSTTVTFTKSDWSNDPDEFSTAIIASKDGISIRYETGSIPSSSAYVSFVEGETLTISSTVGNITDITFTPQDAEHQGNCTNQTGLSTTSWTLTVDVPKTNAQIKTIVVTYSTFTLSNYTTSCACEEGVVSVYNVNNDGRSGMICLHQVGETTTYMSAKLKLPTAKTGNNFWVGIGNGQNQTAKTKEWPLSRLCLAESHDNKGVCAAATESGKGIYGKFVAYSDHQEDNYFIGFIPDWQITFGVTDNPWAKVNFVENPDPAHYVTDFLTTEQLNLLKANTTVNFYVGADAGEGNNTHFFKQDNNSDYSYVFATNATYYADGATKKALRGEEYISNAEAGKFEIWANSGDYNAWPSFIPYYTLKYNANNGNAQGEMTPNELTTGSTTVQACGFTAPTGKTFIGWATHEGANAGVVYQPGDTYTFGDSRNNATNTLYAVWQEAQTVTWIAGGTTIKTENIASGSTATAPDVTACDKNEIVGWTTETFTGVQDALPENPLSLNGTTGQINANTTYHAIYKRTDADKYALKCIHKVTLMSDGMVHETQWIEHGKNAQNPSTNGRKPTDCDEWAQASNTAWTLTEITTEQTEQPTYRGFGTGVTEDITLYAVFSKAGGSTPLADNTYRLATSTDDLVAGSKVAIVAWGYTFVEEDYELTDDYMLSIEDQTSTNNTSRKAYKCNATNGQTDTSRDWLTLTNAAASCVFTLEAGAVGTYTLKGNNNKYLSTVNDKNHLIASDESTDGNWTITFDEDVATFQHGENSANKGSLIRCAKSGEDEDTAIYFTAYNSENADSHTPVHLYVHPNKVSTYTTSPNCGPRITVTGNVNVTAAPNTMARSVGTLEIEATNLDKYNKVAGANEPHYFSATSTNSHFQIAWVGEDGEVKTLSTKINAGSFNIANGNTTWNTRLTVFYTPDANAENTTETTTIKIYVTSNNTAGNESTKCAECELEVTGRVLPRQFALVAAVTKGEEENETTTYYALPNNMSKSDGNDIQARTWSGLEVMLDNNGALVNPPAEAVYSAYGLQEVGTTIPTVEGINSISSFTDNNNRYFTQFVRLMGADNKALWSGTVNTIKNGGNQLNNVWQLQSEDLENYYIAHQPRLNESKPTYLLYNTGADYFGAYKKAADKLSLRIVPISSANCNYYPAPALEALNVEHNAATIKVSMPNGFSQFNITNWEYRLNNGENNGEWTRATETPIALTNLTQSTTYTVEVRATATITDACETNRKVASVTFTTPKQPCNITNLRATVSPTSAKLEWGGNATGLNLYQYSDALGNGMTLVQENVTSGYIWNNLSMGKYYYYSIGNNECLSPISSFITNNNAFDIVEWKVDSIVIEPWIDIAGMNFEIEQEQTEEVTGEERLKTQTLLISKYFEGAGDLKMVAIYNGTGAAVNLDNYVLRQTIRAYKVRDGQPASYGVNETKDIALSSLGTIKDKQEIIFYTWPQKQSTGNLGALYNLSETFLSQREAEEYSGVNAQTRWVGCGKNRKTNTNLTFSTDLSFNGDDMIQLIFKNGTEETLIDQFGATNPKNCPTMRNCGNEVGWEGMCSNMDYGKSLDDLNEGVSEDKQLTSTDQLADMKINTTDVRIPLHTARVIMFRSNLVTSGATTANSGSDFATLETEWVGRNLCRESNDAELTVFAYEALGNMNFAQYFTSYVSYVESKPFTGNGAKNNGDGTYTVPADRGTKGTEGYTNLQNIACQNIRIKITEGTGDSKNIIASQEVKVPIMITPEMTTAGGEATNQPTYITNDTRITTPNSAKLEHDDDHNPVLAGKDYTICKDCDVVILSGARLQVEADDPTEQTVNIDGEDIPVALQARDVYVYDGAKLILDNDVYFNTLTIRAKEDEVAVANLQNFLHLTDDDGLHHDKRIKGTRWYFFSLPYDCYIEDVTWANGNTATYGVDWLLQTYDGKKRADDAAEGATITANYYLWKDYTPEKDDKYDGIIHAGTGFMIAIEVREGHDYRTLRFPMAVGHRIDDNGINQYNAREAGTDNRNGNSVKEVPVYAWGAKKDYLDRTTGAYTNTEGGTVRATNIGWNLIGVPFTDTYTPIKGISSSSSSDNGLYTSIGVTYDAAIKANYEAVLMTYELDSEQPTSTNINVVNYAKYDADGNQDGYEQYFTDIRLNQEKAEGRYYIMKPFLAYFVQVPGRAVAEYGENNTVISVGDVSSIEKLENSKEFVLRFEPKGATDHYDANTQQSISRRRIGEEPTYYQAEAKRIYVELKLTNPRQESDFTTIRMHNAFKDKYEVGNDMTKMRGSAYANFTTPVLASQLKAGHEAGSDLAFQCLPDSSVQNLPITYWVAEQGTYTFSLSRITDFEYIREAYLFDAETQTYTNLLLGNYEFTSTRGNFTNRFYLNIVPNREIPDPVIETPDPTTGLENSSVSGVGVSVSQDGQIYLYSLPMGSELYFFNAEGKLLYADQTNRSAYELNAPAAGVYFIRIHHNGEARTMKAIVK